MIALILRVLMGTSLIGCGASIVALVLGSTGRESMPFWYACVLVGSAVATLTGLFVVQFSVQHRFGGREVKRLLLRGAPLWLQRLSIGLTLTGLGVWVTLGVTGYEPAPGGLSYLMAGAFGLFLFPAGFVSFLSFLRKRPELNRHCQRGHELPLGARFCPKCGEDVQQSG